MIWKFDPAISSTAYLALAREQARQHAFPQELGWMLKWDDFDFGVHRSHVDQLLDPCNWSKSVTERNLKPRAFIDAYWNQSGNVEIRSIGGHSYSIYFRDDWTWHFFQEATSGAYGGHRSTGELMWMRDFAGLHYLATHQKSSVAKALLFGFKMRLDELVREISARINVVGYMDLQFQYEEKDVARVRFLPNVPIEQIRAWQDELFG